MFGLLFFMPLRQADAHPGRRVSAWQGLQSVAHPQLMTTAGVGALVSVATFSFFTFVSPYLLDVTGVDVRWLSAAMLGFGLCAIAGNLLGGYLADAMGPVGSTLAALAGLTFNLLGLYVLNGSPAAMTVLVGSLGMFFFCIVTLLTLRLLKQAQALAPESTAVAAGLNIASFNLGTALGGGLGSLTISYADLSLVPLAGASAAAAAGAILWLQTRRVRLREATVQAP